VGSNVVVEMLQIWNPPSQYIMGGVLRTYGIPSGLTQFIVKKERDKGQENSVYGMGNRDQR
jgi:hypothetical protein